MSKRNAPANRFDVSDRGASQMLDRYILEKIIRGRLHVITKEKEALKRQGYDPDRLTLIDRIGDTGVFTRACFSAPILVNEYGEVRDTSKQESES